MLVSFSAPFLFGKSSVISEVVYYDTALASSLGSVLSSTTTFGYETLNLTNTWTNVTTSLGSGTQVVYFNTMTSNTMTVRIVGAGGYSTIESASTASNNFDVIFVTKSYNTTTAVLDVDTTIKTNLTFGLFVEDGYTSTLSATMGGGIKNLYLYGNANINVTGNSLDNIILGNSGKNTIYGLTGVNTMIGNQGDLTYGGSSVDISIILDPGPVYTSPSSGNDIIFVATMTVSGNSSSTVVAGSGNDIIIPTSYPGAVSGIKRFLWTDATSFDRVDLSYMFNADGTRIQRSTLFGAPRSTVANGATTVNLSGLLINYDNTTSTGAVTMTTGSFFRVANFLPTAISSISTTTPGVTTSTTLLSVWNNITTNTNFPVIY